MLGDFPPLAFVLLMLLLALLAAYFAHLVRYAMPRKSPKPKPEKGKVKIIKKRRIKD